MIPLIIQDQFHTIQNLQRSPIPQTSNWSGTFFCCFLQQTGSSGELLMLSGWQGVTPPFRNVCHSCPITIESNRVVWIRLAGIQYSTIKVESTTKVKNVLLCSYLDQSWRFSLKFISKQNSSRQINSFKYVSKVLKLSIPWVFFKDGISRLAIYVIMHC